MRAFAIFPGKRDFGVVSHDEPAVEGPHDVKLRMLEVGVCGTDREIAAYEYGTPPQGCEYLVLGHESLGEVVETGSGVAAIRPGDLAAITVRRPCPDPSCSACRGGRQDFCYTGQYTERGIKEAHGFLAEYVVEHEQYVVRLPQRLRDTGVLTEPLTIAEKAIKQVWDIQERLPWVCPPEKGRQAGHCHTAVVLGAGPVGLLGAMALRVCDFEVWVYSRTPAPNPAAATAEAIGARYVSSEQTPVDEFFRMAGNVDLVYEATGASQFAFDVLRGVGANAVYVFTGVPGPAHPVEFDTATIMRNMVLNNQVVFGTVNAGRDAFETAVEHLEVFEQRWPAAVRSLITGRHSLDDARDLLLGKGSGIKDVVVI